MPAQAREHPISLDLICSAELVIGEAAEGRKLPTVSMVAYNGGAMRVPGWMDPVVIDLAGVAVPTQKVAIRRNHDNDRTIGHTDAVRVTDRQITATGVISFDTEAAREVVGAARNGFPWQASVGMNPDGVEFLPTGSSTTVNSSLISGPADIIRRSTLREITIVDLGADASTSVQVAASAKERAMAQDDKTTAEAEKKSETPASSPPLGSMPAPEAFTSAEAMTKLRAERAAELERIGSVEKIAGKHPEIAARAVRDGWGADKTELEVVRAERANAPAIHAHGSGAVLGAELLEAAACETLRIPKWQDGFEKKTVDAAHKMFRGRIGLQELMLLAAELNGKHYRSFNSVQPKELLQAAFSTQALPGILSNLANKSMLQGWMFVEQAWRAIAGIGSVKDFKQVTRYRLNGAFQYDKVGPGGELHHGTDSESTYTNQADTYGKMFAITRTDIINDDLGALQDLPRRIGRGAALKLNDVFWTLYLADSAFYNVGNKNYFTGATTNLQLSSLTTAVQMFRDQTDPDGKPIGIQPRFLLVPTSLENPAKTLMQSTEVRDTTVGVKFGTGNPFANNFSIVVSSYLGNTSYVGNSQTAWYLLADPQDEATVEVVFLNGVQEPTVDSADADFDVLGIQMRGYHDFGVSFREPRAGVKSKGIA